MITRYQPYTLYQMMRRETDAEFDPQGWTDDPDMDVEARDWRDDELWLDLSGCLDADL